MLRNVHRFTAHIPVLTAFCGEKEYVCGRPIMEATSNRDRRAGPFLFLVRRFRRSQSSGAEYKRKCQKTSGEFNFHVYLPRFEAIRQNPILDSGVDEFCPRAV